MVNSALPREKCVHFFPCIILKQICNGAYRNKCFFFQDYFPCISPVAVVTAAGLMVTTATQMDGENEKGKDCFILMFLLHLSAIICSLFLL